jgi:SEC-C motif-containing protein
MEIPYADEKALDAHCMPLIRGERHASTPAELMASRYVAYRVGAIDYLVESNDPKTRNQIDRKAAEEWSERAKFNALEIVSTTQGGPDDEVGEVEFIARYTIKGALHTHHERSQFRRLDGRWYFVSGDRVSAPPVRNTGPKVGRNDPCPCGSGKKYKKCCAAAA